MKRVILALFIVAMPAIAEMPVVSKYDEDLLTTPGLNANAVNLYGNVRDYARSQMALEGQRGVVDSAYDNQECLKGCQNSSTGYDCINNCVQSQLRSLAIAPDHQPGDVNCSGNHNH